MKKISTITLACLITACSNVENVGPFEEDKAICRENADTVIAHMKGWQELSSDYIKERFHSVTDRDGKRTDFYRWVLTATVSDGQDTLIVSADDSKGTMDEEWWGGSVFERIITSGTAQEIKRQNLAIKRACGNDSCFDISVNASKVLSATFRKNKPKEPEPPLEDYGLTDEDIRK